MYKQKKKLEDVFDIDTTARLSFSEKENLYGSIIREARRKRRNRFLSKVGTIVAVIVGVLVVLYSDFNEQDSKEFFDIKSVAREHADQFQKDSAAIQVASFKYQEQSTRVAIIEKTNVQEGGRLLLDPDSSQEGYSTLYIPYGKRQEVILPDGSTVWLNSGSYLTFNNTFEGELREVYLNGEGYFDIKRNGKPFVIRTAQTDIMVLGTSFNTSSYEDDDFFSIDLLTGKVELNSPNKKFKSIAMNSGERITIDYIKNTVQMDKNSIGDDILWTKRQLALKNVKMGELLKRIERIYNVKINAVDEVYKMDIGYSGRLNVAVDVEKSLASIYELQHYKIRLKEKEVFITKKK